MAATSTQGKVRVNETKNGYFIELPPSTNGRLVEDVIRYSVPINWKSFDATRNRWFIEDRCMSVVEKAFEQFFALDDVTYTFLEREDPPYNYRRKDSFSSLTPPQLLHTYHDALYLLPTAPIEVAESAYRALAKKYHPDASKDDGQRMREINDAIEAIRGMKE